MADKNKEFNVHDSLKPWLVRFVCRNSLLLSGIIAAHCDGVHTQPESVVDIICVVDVTCVVNVFCVADIVCVVARVVSSPAEYYK